jgi:hypothetical protein
MLGVVLFIALWVVLALGLFLVAMRGRAGGAREAFRGRSPGTRLTYGVTFVALYVGFGAVLPAVFLTGNHRNASKQIGGIRLTAGEKSGRELFGEHCGLCHTLAAANAVGKVGPNLDQIQPSRSLVLHTIQYGCLQNAPTSSPQTCLGYGTMPANVLQGRQAQEVAAFVATVAGKE